MSCWMMVLQTVSSIVLFFLAIFTSIPAITHATTATDDDSSNIVTIDVLRNGDNNIATKDATISLGLTYGVNIDSTLPSGKYTNIKPVIHLDIEPDVYHLKYIDGEGQEQDVEQKHNPVFTLPTVDKAGYTLKEFNTKSDGTGESYQPGDQVTVDYCEITLYTIWEANYRSVTWYPNGGSPTPPPTKVQETFPLSSALTELPTVNRSGFHFVGWYTLKEAGGDKVTLDTVINNDTTYYARWEPCNSSAKTIHDAIYMQDINSDVIASMDLEESYTLKDIRDNKEYTITKLNDGQVWMNQNLDLDLTHGTILTPDTTNIGEPWNPESSTITKVSKWSEKEKHPMSYDPGEEYIVSSNTTLDEDISYTSFVACKVLTRDGNICSHSSVGNYYNWSAAVASNDTTHYNKDNQIAPYSICPKGWRLPSSASTSLDAVNMLYAQSIIKNKKATTSYDVNGFYNIRDHPVYWVRAGYIYAMSRNDDKEKGYYWSNTAASGTYAYNIVFDNSNVILRNGGYARSIGLPIRCVAIQ